MVFEEVYLSQAKNRIEWRYIPIAYVSIKVHLAEEESTESKVMNYMVQQRVEEFKRMVQMLCLPTRPFTVQMLQVAVAANDDTLVLEGMVTVKNTDLERKHLDFNLVED